jgi:hypothetical protein
MSIREIILIAFIPIMIVLAVIAIRDFNRARKIHMLNMFEFVACVVLTVVQPLIGYIISRTMKKPKES